MKHDITDKPSRQRLVQRYLDGATTIEEERLLAAYYLAATPVDEDDCEAAALILAFDRTNVPPVEAPSVEAVDEFDRLLSVGSQTVDRRADRWHTWLWAGCAAAAVVAVLGYFVARPADHRDAADSQLASVTTTCRSAVRPSSATQPSHVSVSAESASSAKSYDQTTAGRRHKAAADNVGKTSGGSIDLDRVLKAASASSVNVGIERKGNVFLVSSAAADGTVNTYIIDASDNKDLAVYDLTDADRHTAEHGIDGESDVHGPNL